MLSLDTNAAWTLLLCRLGIQNVLWQRLSRGPAHWRCMIVAAVCSSLRAAFVRVPSNAIPWDGFRRVAVSVLLLMVFVQHERITLCLVVAFTAVFAFSELTACGDLGGPRNGGIAWANIARKE